MRSDSFGYAGNRKMQGIRSDGRSSQLQLHVFLVDKFAVHVKGLRLKTEGLKTSGDIKATRAVLSSRYGKHYVPYAIEMPCAVQNPFEKLPADTGPARGWRDKHSADPALMTPLYPRLSVKSSHPDQRRIGKRTKNETFRNS